MGFLYAKSIVLNDILKSLRNASQGIGVYNRNFTELIDVEREAYDSIFETDLNHLISDVGRLLTSVSERSHADYERKREDERLEREKVPTESK